MNTNKATPGMTQMLVKAQGFREAHGQLMLIDEQGFGRIFFELTADPDQARYLPEEGYEQLLRSMQPGLSLRMMRIYWPNPEPRKDFLKQVGAWTGRLDPSAPKLKRDLEDFLTAAPLPFFSQIILECVVLSEETLTWIHSIPDILHTNGILARVLTPAEIQALAHTLFNSQLK